MRLSAPSPAYRQKVGPAAAYKADSNEAAHESRYQITIGILVALAVVYNALIAMAGVAGLNISAVTVMIVEPFILIFALLTVLRKPLDRNDLPSILLAFTFLIITVYISIINQTVFPDTMRNIVIIAIYSMLGLRSSLATVRRTFLVVTIIITAVLILEIVDTPAYVNLFEPAQYFSKTRGLEIPTWDDSGLFGNALGFKARFSFGISSHRTASLFLEQLSLANFAAVLTVYLMTLWSRLPKWQVVFYIFVIITILVTNDTRTSLILAVLAPMGYFLYPRMPRFMNLAIAPLLIFIAWVIEDPTRPYNDDFAGRLSLTVRTLKAMDLPAALGTEAFTAMARFADSGYTYFTYSATLPGMAALWIFMACFVPQITAEQKRFGYAACLFMACSLVVAGTSIFTIKIAGMLWFLAGFVRGRDKVLNTGNSDAARPSIKVDKTGR